MSPRGTVRAAHIWKRFRADWTRRYMRDQLTRLWRAFLGDGQRGWRWVLRDVSLDLEPGESVGVVGVNGSGKSTFLKILNRVMYPYAGRLDVAGRVAALIEIGAGMHPELTGGENIYLTGSLLGLRRQEIARRHDEIVAFAELETAVDRQVKFYSSGMRMRLGFAVAASLRPDILLVDEVLAVGDAAFQQKSLNRMRTMLSDGVTLVFVSHDLAAVEATCMRGLWLEGGVVSARGPVGEVLGAYRRAIEETAQTGTGAGGILRVARVAVGTDHGGASSHEELRVAMAIESPHVLTCAFYLGVSEGPATPIFVVRRDLHLAAGKTEVRCAIQRLPLPRGRFYLWLGAFDPAGHDLLSWHPVMHFDVAGPDLDWSPRGVVRLAPVLVQATWEVERE
jgi:ABC-2 type transport system ATP-binding protein